MIKFVKKMMADKSANYRVNLRYQGDPNWYPCTVLDADQVGVMVEVQGENVAIPWSGIAALSFAATNN